LLGSSGEQTRQWCEKKSALASAGLKLMQRQSQTTVHVRRARQQRRLLTATRREQAMADFKAQWVSSGHTKF
jgi:hypothetical protein